MSDETNADDKLRAWVEGQPIMPGDPERERGVADDLAGAIYRRPEVDGAAVDALLELVSHEIRTPFAVIQGAAGLLLRDLEDLSDEHQVIAHQIYRNSRVGLLLLDRLATVREVDAGSLVLDRSPVQIVQLVKSTVAELQEVVLGTRPVEIRDDVGEELTAPVDVRRVRQIIFNLLANAALNTPPDALIHVAMRETGESVEVEVRDDGHGVAPADAERIFEKFPALSASRQGPGVGLYISRGLARAHGGELFTEPAEEQGGVFVLRLPLDGG